MADMGLGNMMGAAGAGDAIATVMAQRRQAALDQQAQANFQQQMAQQDALTRLKVAEQADAVRSRIEAGKQAAADKAQAQRNYRAEFIDKQLQNAPANASITDETRSTAVGSGILPERFAQNPININTGDGANVAPAPPNALAPMGPSLTPIAAPDTTTIPQPPPEQIGGGYQDPAPSFKPVANDMMANLPPAEGGTPQMLPGAQLSVPDRPVAPVNSPAPNRLSWHLQPTAKQAQEAALMQALSPVGQGGAPVRDLNTPAGRLQISNAGAHPNDIYGPVKTSAEKLGPIHDTENGLVRVGDDNNSTPIYGPDGKPAQGFHQPPAPFFFVGENGLSAVNKGNLTARPVRDANTGETLQKPAKPLPTATAENVASLNVAEVEAVKVLRSLHDSGLDQSNDPADPRWEKFVVTTLKMAPADFTKADIQQRTAFINAAMTRQLMGGRPSQYVAQLIQDHLPKGEMTGQQLAHVITNVLEQAGEKRTELGSLLGTGVKGPTSGQGYHDYLDEIQGGGTVRMVAPDGRQLNVPSEKVDELLKLGAKKVQ